jgi:hypothetical protein
VQLSYPTREKRDFRKRAETPDASYIALFAPIVIPPRATALPGR